MDYTLYALLSTTTLTLVASVLHFVRYENSEKLKVTEKIERRKLKLAAQIAGVVVKDSDSENKS